MPNIKISYIFGVRYKQCKMKQPNKKPIGRPKNETETARYHRRIHPKLVQPMNDHLAKLKAELINEIEVKE